MFYDLAADTWDDAELEALQEVIRSRRFTMGPKVKEFERAFADWHGMAHGIMVNSGSSANLLAVAALCYRKDRPLQRGDEVIVPAISWATTYAPFQQYGIALRFVDVDPATLNVDMAKLEAALTPRTRAICAVSILGNPAPLPELRAFADAHGLVLFEDNCESLGASVGGEKAGTFGALNSSSFFFSHHISTAEGGMVVTDDRELADLCRAIRAHGWTRDLEPDSPIFERRENDFFEAYRFLLPGYNLRPTEFSGATGIVQLAKLPAMIAARRENLALFQALFGGDERFTIQRENGQSSSFSFTFVLHPRFERARVLAALAEADIAHRIITGGCFTRHEAIHHFEHSISGSLSNAEYAHDHGFFVGNFPFDLTPQLERLRAVLDTVCV